MINTLLQNLAENPVKRANNRRSFLRGSLVTGAAIASAAALGERKSFAQVRSRLRLATLPFSGSSLERS
jgi:TAT (twin-arginine translocation) pathway signal sequence